MNLDDLYMLVTEAILRSDTLADLGAPGAAAAYLDVSRLEEEIAKLLAVSDPEGALARRGAVRAALKGGDHVRARSLTDRYLAEPDVTQDLRNDFRRVWDETEPVTTVDTEALAQRFPAAAERYGIDAIVALAKAKAAQPAPLAA